MVAGPTQQLMRCSDGLPGWLGRGEKIARISRLLNSPY